MNTFRRYQHFLFISLYILILISPAFYFSAKGALRALYPLLILIGLLNVLPLRYPWRWFFILTSIFFVMIPSVHFFALTFKAPFNETLWVIAQGTNLIETKDYIKANSILPLLADLFFVFIWFFYFKFYKNNSVQLGRKTSIFFLLFLTIPFAHILKNPHHLLEEFNHHFTESYPLNAVFSYISAQKDMQNFSQYKIADLDKIELQNPSLSTRTVVLVIGESATRHRLQLYGANAENNPLMMKIKPELFIFNDMITLHPHTMASIPVILTQKNGLGLDRNVKPEEQPESADQKQFPFSFIQVFKKAGYKTFWISNQASMGGSSSRIGFYARSTDYQKFFHIYDANNPTMYDEAVLEDFQKNINDPAPLKLFVLHLQGSHYNFKSRVPLKFQKLADDYDNTLLYTDWILSETIDLLKKQQGPSGLVYLSDHGLLLNACGKAYTHFDNKEAFEIPFWLWLSPIWKNQNAEKVKHLSKNTSLPLTTEYVFDSLLDIGGIDYTRAQKKLSLFDLLNPLDLKDRHVKTYSQIVNYDQGSNDSDCHLH